jgi:hypothetical protein
VKPTGPHRVKIVSDKLIRKMNTDGVEEHFVRYVFEENGQQKQYDAHMKSKVGNDPHYLVQALAEVEPGEELRSRAHLERNRPGAKAGRVQNLLQWKSRSPVAQWQHSRRKIWRTAARPCGP